MPRPARLFRALGELIVDRSLVDHFPSLGLEANHLGRPFHVQGERHRLVGIQQVGHATKAKFHQFIVDGLFVLVWISIDHPELHLFPLELTLELLELGAALACDGTSRSREKKNHRAPWCSIEFLVLTADVQEVKVGGGACQKIGAQQGKQKACEEDVKHWPHDAHNSCLDFARLQLSDPNWVGSA